MVTSTVYLGKIIESLCKKDSKVNFISELKISEEYSDGTFKIPLKIYGTAFKAGTYKGIIFTEKEINNPKIPLEKKTCDLDHDNKNRGRVDIAEHKNGKVTYVAIINDVDMAKDIYNGKIKYVSPNIDSKRCFIDGETYAKDLEFTGLSFLKNKSPASEGTTVLI
jgi:hypothetical protein